MKNNTFFSSLTLAVLIGTPILAVKTKDLTNTVTLVQVEVTKQNYLNGGDSSCGYHALSNAFCIGNGLLENYSNSIFTTLQKLESTTLGNKKLILSRFGNASGPELFELAKKLASKSQQGNEMDEYFEETEQEPNFLKINTQDGIWRQTVKNIRKNQNFDPNKIHNDLRYIESKKYLDKKYWPKLEQYLIKEYQTGEPVDTQELEILTQKDPQPFPIYFFRQYYFSNEQQPFITCFPQQAIQQIKKSLQDCPLQAFIVATLSGLPECGHFIPLVRYQTNNHVYYILADSDNKPGLEEDKFNDQNIIELIHRIEDTYEIPSTNRFTHKENEEWLTKQEKNIASPDIQSNKQSNQDIISQKRVIDNYNKNKLGNPILNNKKVNLKNSINKSKNKNTNTTFNNTIFQSSSINQNYTKSTQDLKKEIQAIEKKVQDVENKKYAIIENGNKKNIELIKNMGKYFNDSNNNQINKLIQDLKKIENNTQEKSYKKFSNNTTNSSNNNIINNTISHPFSINTNYNNQEINQDTRETQENIELVKAMIESLLPDAKNNYQNIKKFILDLKDLGAKTDAKLYEDILYACML